MSSHGHERSTPPHARHAAGPHAKAPRDGRVPEMCDALADLFIGDEHDAGAPIRQTSARPAPQSAQAPHPLRFPAEPRADAPGPETGPEAGPRTGPVTGFETGLEADPEASSNHAAVTTPVTPTGGVPVELVLVGHLPVRASAWIREYIGARPDASDRPAGLVRVFDGYATSELFPSCAPSQRDGGLMALGAGPEGLGEIAEAIDEMRAKAAQVFVRFGRGDESPLAACDQVDRVSILTGADDAALVAAFQVLKSAVEHRIGAGVPGPLSAVRIVVCGARPEARDHAIGRLRLAMDRFAETAGVEPGEIMAGPGTVGSVPTALIHEGELRMDPRDLVEALGRPAGAGAQTPTIEESPWPELGAAPSLEHLSLEIEQGRGAHDSEPHSEPQGEPNVWTTDRFEPTPEAAPEPVRELTDDSWDHAAVSYDELGVSNGDRHAAGAGLGWDEPRHRATAWAGSSTDAGSEDPAPIGPMPRTSAAPLPGLRRLAARCPHTPDVELCTDDAGTLHLVIRVAPGGTASSAFAGDPEREHASALEALTVARDWAATNIEVLRLTPGADALSGPAIAHLVTPAPRLARRLLDGELRVYAAVPGGDPIAIN